MAKNHIVLIEPEIPYNTGNIARTCVVTGTALHLVRPFGFRLTSQQIARAGMDYWDKVDLTIWDSWQEFVEHACALEKEGTEVLYIETRTPRSLGDLKAMDSVMMVFGSESKGLPHAMMDRNQERCMRIPMLPGSRSLNLSNSAAIVLYEVLRQQDYPGLTR